jgi:phage gp36-like protein
MTRFLIERDYAPTIRNYIKVLITGDNTFTQNDAEDTAIEIASTYLRTRYDVAKVFRGVNKFTPDQQWVIGDMVLSNNKIYVALVNNPGDTLTDITKWETKDPRNKALIMAVVDIAIYYLNSNLAPQNIPELRVKRYDDAITWLNKVQQEKLIVDLPLLDAASPSGSFTLGSKEKVSGRW